MIHPAIVDGEVVFMTRMGRTDVARKAERHLTMAVSLGCRAQLSRVNKTPIFEFTAPDNRIVVRYADSGLTLLAIRDNATGAYDSPAWVAEAAASMGVASVPHHPSDWNSGQAFADYARAVQGMEGFVVRFADGTWVKAKGEDYVLKHKAKESVLQEKNVLALIARGELDDVLPLLDADDRSKIEAYRDDVENGLRGHAEIIDQMVRCGEDFSQKEFAVDYLRNFHPRMRPLAFQVRSGACATEAVRSAILKSSGSQSAVDAARHLHGAIWPL